MCSTFLMEYSGKAPFVRKGIALYSYHTQNMLFLGALFDLERSPFFMEALCFSVVPAQKSRN